MIYCSASCQKIQNYSGEVNNNDVRGFYFICVVKPDWIFYEVVSQAEEYKSLLIQEEEMGLNIQSHHNRQKYKNDFRKSINQIFNNDR